MTTLRVAAVQATYELMNREATIDRVAELTGDAATEGALHVNTAPRPAVVVEAADSAAAAPTFER